MHWRSGNSEIGEVDLIVGGVGTAREAGIGAAVVVLGERGWPSEGLSPPFRKRLSLSLL